MSGERLIQYTQCGLDDVWLANGYHVEETEYGRGLAIDQATELHHVIARAIINNPRPVWGKHARFLRVLLELSQADLGKLLGVDRATVIRWEKARDKPLSWRTSPSVRPTRHASSGGLMASVVKELQEADEAHHGAEYRAIFRTENSGWHESLAA